MADATFVYFIDSDGGAVKVGFSANPMWRLNQFQAMTHNTLAMRGYFPGDYQLEQSIHRRLAPVRIRGEWYLPGKAVDAEFAALGTPELPRPFMPMAPEEIDAHNRIAEINAMMGARQVLKSAVDELIYKRGDLNVDHLHAAHRTVTELMAARKEKVREFCRQTGRVPLPR